MLWSQSLLCTFSPLRVFFVAQLSWIFLAVQLLLLTLAGSGQVSLVGFRDILYQGFREDHGRIGRKTGRARIPRKFAENRSLLKMAVWSRPENGAIHRHISMVWEMFVVSPYQVKNYRKLLKAERGRIILSKSDTEWSASKPYIQQRQTQKITYTHIYISKHETIIIEETISWSVDEHGKKFKRR